MINRQSKSAFTMVELIFVVVIIGILASIAIPRLAASRDDAEISKAQVTVASVRNALAMERQKRILRGDYTPITALGSNATGEVFSQFSPDQSGNQADVLEYSVLSSTSSGNWSINATDTSYTYHQNAMEDVVFTIVNNRFECDMNEAGCKLLTQ